MNFERFWSLYPRKVAKRTAQKAWDKELRAGTDPAEIIAGLERQLPVFIITGQQALHVVIDQSRIFCVKTVPAVIGPFH